MKKSRIDILFILLFLVLCLIPSLGILVFGESDAAANEILSSRPSAQNRDGSFNTELLSDFSDYIADRFAFRQEMVTAWSAINAKVFSASVEEQVILGNDGWLYYRETLDDYLGRGMSDEELEYAARNLALMQEYAENQGAAFVFTIAPNKNSLYPEHMPTYYPKGHDGANAERLPAVLEQYGVNYVDLFEAFRNEEVLYFSTDSHWNAQGAALAADHILSGLGMESSYFSGSFTNLVSHRGDLYEMLYPAGTETETAPAWAGGWTYTTDADPNGGNAITIRTRNPSGTGALLCFRDSFGIALYPYLAQTYADALFSRQSAYDLTQIDAVGADTVVIELVERNLSYLLTQAPIFPAPERDISADWVTQGDGAVTIRLTPGTTAGTAELVQVTGTLPAGTADTGTSVYVIAGGVCYEACRTMDARLGTDGFSAWLPAGAADYSLLTCQNGADTVTACTVQS
ncbi:MAG: hypothetical protein MSH16_05545 [Oscillospiraceae bacterium]|nr:hypothetical protein [Oscillospiraceae bacterium]